MKGLTAPVMIPPAERCIKWMKTREAWLKHRDCDEGHVGVREDGVEYILDIYERGRAKEPTEFERELPARLQQSLSQRMDATGARPSKSILA